MRLSRVIEREYGRYALQVFECTKCQVWYTRGKPDGGAPEEQSNE
jgi:hypothetical protein